MASRREFDPDRVALEALRHFKEAHLAHWLGDMAGAAREFKKCERSVDLLREHTRRHDLDHLREAARLDQLQEKRRLAQLREARRLRPAPEGEPVEFLKAAKTDFFAGRRRQRTRITYNLLPHGSNIMEYRARVRLRDGELRKAASASGYKPGTAHALGERAWQWVEADIERRFTGLFLLTFADGTVFAHIIPHWFVVGEGDVETLSGRITDALAMKLSLGPAAAR